MIFYFCVLTLFYGTLYGMQDDCHFYRASPVLHEPRFDRDWLSTFEAQLGGGHATLANNGNNGDILPCGAPGTFHIVEANLLYIQNILHGFFAEVYLPIRSFCLVSESMDTTSTAQGDFTIQAGYAYSYQYTTKLDFIDVAVTAGIITPTSPHVPFNKPCAIPHGYNGHTGFLFTGDVACGLCEWITLSGHGAMIVFTNTAYQYDVGTLLWETNKRAPLWHLGFMAKADHIMRGISITIAYAYTLQGIIHTNVAFSFDALPTVHTIHNPGFTMHTFHFAFEYDCLQQREYWMGPRICLIYNHILQGTHIFDTNMLIGQCGLELAWDF
jgi:hypothetical protein